MFFAVIYILDYYILVIFSDIWVLFGQLDLFILQWEEVLCDGFDLAVSSPSDRRGSDARMYIKDKKMGSIPT